MLRAGVELPPARSYNPAMSDARQELTRAARQLVEIDRMLGGDFMPAGLNPLPETKAVPVGVPEAGSVRGPEAAPVHEAEAAMDREAKAAALAEMDEREVSVCTKCGLAAGRTNTVFGEGDPDADLVFVGEGPGQEEDRQGRPFVGRAGELLTRMIEGMGLRREDVFICNIVKCRPPGNRAPAPEEAAACWDYLVRQLAIIRPRAIVTLGNPATQGLLNTRTGITKLRGTWQSLPMIGEGLGGTAVMPTFHPAFVLRQYTPENRGKVWSDLKEVMAFLGLPVQGGKPQD